MVPSGGPEASLVVRLMAGRPLWLGQPESKTHWTPNGSGPRPRWLKEPDPTTNFAAMIATTVTLLTALAGAQAPDVGQLVEAKVSVNAETREITIDIPAIPLPPHTGHHGGGGGLPPVIRARLPDAVSVYGFRVELFDAEGTALPASLIHHVNVIDPHARELFLPISRRVLGVGTETGGQKLPWFLFGLPIAAGAELVANAMLHNPTDIDYPSVTTRIILQYVPGSRPWPVFDGYPFQLDVLFPVGDKSFPLPPGRSSKSFEARPAIAGKIVAIGGHLHDHGTKIELTEVETGRVIWSTAPTLDDQGKVAGIPIGKLYGWFKVGATITPDRTYRVTVYYDNPTGELLPEGGMGVVGGLFVPARGTVWPQADKAQALYQQDARHYLRLTAGEPMAEEDHSQHEHPPR